MADPETTEPTPADTTPTEPTPATVDATPAPAATTGRKGYDQATGAFTL